MGQPLETQARQIERERDRKCDAEIEHSLDKSLEQWASVIIETLLSCGATVPDTRTCCMENVCPSPTHPIKMKVK